MSASASFTRSSCGNANKSGKFTAMTIDGNPLSKHAVNASVASRRCGANTLAVFAAIAHGRDNDARRAARIAFAAQAGTLVLDDARGGMYCDLVYDLLSEAAQTELRAMDPAKYQYRSEFAKRYFGQGELHGRAALLQRQLTLRFGPLTAATLERLSTAPIDELDAIGERLLSAQSLEEALGSR